MDVKVFALNFQRSLALKAYLAVKPAFDHTIIRQSLS